jgi:hypothetical protein
MSNGVKTALIVGGVAVGAFVLLRMLPAGATTALRKPQTDSGVNVNGIVGTIGSLASLAGSLFGGGGQKNEGTYHSDTSGFSISGNSLLDASGNAVTYGTDY